MVMHKSSLLAIALVVVAICAISIVECVKPRFNHVAVVNMYNVNIGESKRAEPIFRSLWQYSQKQSGIISMSLTLDDLEERYYYILEKWRNIDAYKRMANSTFFDQYFQQLLPSLSNYHAPDFQKFVCRVIATNHPQQQIQQQQQQQQSCRTNGGGEFDDDGGGGVDGDGFGSLQMFRVVDQTARPNVEAVLFSLVRFAGAFDCTYELWHSIEDPRVYFIVQQWSHEKHKAQFDQSGFVVAQMAVLEKLITSPGIQPQRTFNWIIPETIAADASSGYQIQQQSLQLVNGLQALKYDLPAAATTTTTTNNNNVAAPFTQDEYMTQQMYKYNAPSAVRVSPSTGQMYMSVSRWIGGSKVPATLCKVVPAPQSTTEGASSSNNDNDDDTFGGVLLEPFPDWASNNLNNNLNNNGGAGSFQLVSVSGFEIDVYNRMWILDQGRLGTNAASAGAIKLVIYDLSTSSVVRVHQFSPQVAPPATAFLTDIVVDADNGFAYISDSSLATTGSGSSWTSPNPGIIVYDFNTDTSYRVLSNHTSVQPEPKFVLAYNNQATIPSSAPISFGVSGIALTNDKSRLYWTSIYSRQLYFIETCRLRLQQATTNIEQHVKQLGTKISANRGIVISDVTNTLFTTSIELNAITAIDLRTGMERIVVQDDRVVWADSVTFDHQGSLLFTSTRYPSFVAGTLDWGHVTIHGTTDTDTDTSASTTNTTAFNFGIWKVYTGEDSYAAASLRTASNAGPSPTTSTGASVSARATEYIVGAQMSCPTCSPCLPSNNNNGGGGGSNSSSSSSSSSSGGFLVAIVSGGFGIAVGAVVVLAAQRVLANKNQGSNGGLPLGRLFYKRLSQRDVDDGDHHGNNQFFINDDDDSDEDTTGANHDASASTGTPVEEKDGDNIELREVKVN